MITWLLILSGILTALGFASFKYKAWAVQEPLEDPEVPVTPSIPTEPPKPLPMPEKTKREHLYDTAYASRGKDMSPLDRAPDNLACMESMDGVYFAAFGEHLLTPANRLSTNLGYKSMLADPRLALIPNADALPGDMVISPTGYSTKGTKNGHCGCWGKSSVMSNDSSTGKWTANYSHAAWYNVFENVLGFPVYFFRVKD